MQLREREKHEITQRLDAVRRHFPVPFSMFAGELLHELSAREPNWSRIFSLQIDFFEGCVSFFAFVLFAEIEHHPTLSLKYSLNDLRTFRTGKKLSTGHWWSLLRGMSKDLSGSQDLQFSEATQVALNLFYPNKQLLPARLHGFAKALDSVPSTRNQIKGHSYTPSIEQYAEHAKALLTITMDFLSVIQPIDRSTVFYVTQCIATMEDEFQLDILTLDGDMRRPSRKGVNCRQSIAVGSIWICQESDIDTVLDKRRCRALSPFVEYDVAKNTLYICQHAHNEQFELLGVVGGERIQTTDSTWGFRRLDTVLDRAMGVNSAYEQVLSIAKEMGEKLLQSPAAKASYNPQTYLARPRLSQQLEAVGQRSDDDNRIWLTSAPSGSGKTAMVCHAVAQWLDGGQHDLITVVALSSDIMSAQGSVHLWWEQKFGASVIDTCCKVQKEKGLIRLFIDGLDRLGAPEKVVDDLVTMFQEPVVCEVLRVITTATELVSNQVSEALTQKSLGKLVSRWSIPPLSPTEARALFIRIHPSATDVQLGEEVQKLLTSPLLVRLAQVLGEHESTVGITPGRLLRAHADRTVLSDPVRSHLALDIVSKILDKERKSLELSELLKDASLRTVLLTSGENSPLRQLINDHVVLLDRSPTSNGLPLPSRTVVSFAFDAQLDYLAFAQLASDIGVNPLDWLNTLRGRAPFGPLIGALRIFVVESLLDASSLSQIESLSNLLVGLGETGEEVLKDLLTVGLRTSNDAPFFQLLSLISREISAEDMTRIADEAIQRMVIAGRAKVAFELMEALWTVRPCALLVDLCRKVIHIAVWAVGIEEARRFAERLSQDSASMSVDERVIALEAHREVCTLSGLRADRETLAQIVLELDKVTLDDVHTDGAKVILNLIEARKCNLLKRPEEVNTSGPLRGAYLEAAMEAAGESNDLRMMVYAERALLFAEEGLHIESRAVRQQVAEEAVEFACKVGDPFAEALGCDVVATVWHTDLRVRMEWIERGLVGAKALNAEIARARLLDKRGRIYLAQGRLDQAILDARESATIFESVGHQRHTLRTRQHLYALSMHETGDSGTAFEGWKELIPQANELGLPFQERLIRTLYASILCDLGRVTDAAQQIQVVESQITNLPLDKDVHLGLVKGKVLAGQQQWTEAFEQWEAAQHWAGQINFADVFFQSFLQNTWTQLLMPISSPSDEQETRQQSIQQIRTHLEKKSFSVHQARYAGELRLVLSLALFLEGWMEEAQSRLHDAKAWFAEHPQHPKNAELAVVELLFEQRSLLDQSNHPQFSNMFIGITSTRLRSCRDKVRQLASGFKTEEDVQRFVMHHPVEKLVAKFVRLEP